jgi:hypothetical protein
MAGARVWLVLGALCAATAGACAREQLALVGASDQARTPPSVRDACALAEQRCSRCHDLERIQLAHHAMVDWPVYVDRMRRMPGSGITPGEASVILRCLDWMATLQRERELYSHER